MANYYTTASFEVELTEAARTWLLGLDEIVGDRGGDETDEIELTTVQETEYGEVIRAIQKTRELVYTSGVDVTAEETTLWFYADENFNVEYAEWLISTTLKKFDLDDAVSFEWSNTCSSPRTDGFGGGWVIVTKDKTFWGPSGGGLASKLQEIEYDRSHQFSAAWAQKLSVVQALMLYSYNVEPLTQFEAVYGTDCSEDYRAEKLAVMDMGVMRWWGQLDTRAQRRLLDAALHEYEEEARRRYDHTKETTT